MSARCGSFLICYLFSLLLASFSSSTNEKPATLGHTILTTSKGQEPIPKPITVARERDAQVGLDWLTSLSQKLSLSLTHEWHKKVILGKECGHKRNSGYVLGNETHPCSSPDVLKHSSTTMPSKMFMPSQCNNIICYQKYTHFLPKERWSKFSCSYWR